MLFFFIQGLIIPNLDDIHYFFLTHDAGMPRFEYNFLNIIVYISVIIVTILYNSYFDKTQVWIMILVS